MTIGVGWLRGDAAGGELWIATDSRLSGDGNLWDECPKLSLLPRRDAIAAFSGSTGQAYPLLIQISNAIRSYGASASGALEFFDLLGHLERVAGSMLGSLAVDPLLTGAARPREFSTRGDVIVIGGFSRQRHGLVLRALQYERSANGWKFTQVRPLRSLGRGRTIRIFGDRVSRSKYRHRLKLLLEERGTLKTARPFDLEPLEALGEFLSLPPTDRRPLPDDHRPMTVGDPPQVARVVAGADATPFVVRWPDQGSTAEFLFGRRCLSYERIDLPLITFGLGGAVSTYGPGEWPSSSAITPPRSP